MEHVSKLERYGVSSDGRLALATFALESGGVRELVFPLSTLRAVLSDLSTLLTSGPAIMNRENAGIVEASPPRSIRAEPADSGKSIVLTIDMKSGAQHFFGLDRDQAKALEESIRASLSRRK